MSTASSPQPAPLPPRLPPAQRELRVYSHSNLFYWWPVWAVGFLMALITFIDGGRMVVVDRGATVQRNQEGQDSITFTKDQAVPVDAHNHPALHMARSKGLGVSFCVVLLLIIVVSNVPLRGLWSVMIILFILMLFLIFALMDWWSWIVEKFSLLDIRINAGGYLFIATVLFLIWAVTVFIFDHRSYVSVTPGQVRVSQAIGSGETVYDTVGMTFQKHQNDLFRHWIIGMGSGDLILHRTGTKEEIDLPNVLFVGSKIKEIEQLIKEKEVV